MSRPLATFFVIGAMKAGTTSLYEYLGSHPAIFMPAVKEPDFFSVDAVWKQGVDWYTSLYGAGALAAARGDCSPSYSMRDQYPRTASRMVRAVPDARVIYLVRHPLERIVSMWLHHAFTGRERRPLVDAVRSDPRYLETSRYSWQLEPYLDVMPRERITVESAENLRARRRATVGGIVEAIGVPKHALPSFNLGVEHHASASKRLPYGLRAGRSWHERPRWPPDRRRRVVQRLTTRRLAARRLALPSDIELQSWEALMPDLAILRSLVGHATFRSWGWRLSRGDCIADLM